MDQLDNKILKALVLYPLESKPRLARKLRISREVLTYRIHRLQDKDKLIEYTTILNVFKLNDVRHYWLGLRYDLTTEEENLLIPFLKGTPWYNTGVPTVGNFDVGMTCVIGKNESPYDIINKINSQTNGKITEFNVLEVVEKHYFESHFLGIDYTKEKHFSRKLATPLIFGEKDLQIIHLLFGDPQKRLTEISQETQLSIDTVRKKVKWFYQENIVHPSIEIDFLKLGFYSFFYMANTKFLDETLRQKIISYAQTQRAYKEVAFAVGEFNLLVNFVVRDTIELRACIRQLRGVIGEITKDNLLILSPEKIKNRSINLATIFKP